MHDGDVAVELRLELLRRFRAAHIGRYDAQLLGVEPHVLVVVDEDRHGRHVVHGHVEEALDGVLVKVDGDDAVDAGNRDEVGDQTRGDRLARGGFALLARVSVMRHDRANGTSGCTLGGVGHDEQLHERIVHVVIAARADRLHEEHVGAAHAVDVARVNLAVRELLKLHVAKLHVQMLGDPIGQRRIRRPREQRQRLVHLRHIHSLPSVEHAHCTR